MNQAPQPRADGKYPQPQRIGEALTGVDDVMGAEMEAEKMVEEFEEKG